jgi:RsiW-degrading membrane proteinase PrsW (M82 family)
MLPLSPSTILLALVGGVVPTLVWLWFWLQEDRLRPEPKRLLLFCFVLGMCGVPLAVPLEQFVFKTIATPIFVFFAWAVIEEVIKYLAAYAGGMHKHAKDEPVNALIYLITAALGFAAAENTLFILDPIITGDIFGGLMTINIRFMGTTLLHIVASAIIGSAVAFSFYKSKRFRHEVVVCGFILAVTLHGLFNFLILHAGPHGIFFIFLCIWVLIIGLLLVFERIKKIGRSS